jgi:hypothetical protein
MSLGWIRLLFLVAAVYDIVLGVGFALCFKPVYEWFGIELPNHPAYVQLPGLLIAIFGVGFLFVSASPLRNRSIVVLGILMKLTFSGLTFGHWLFDSIPVVYVVFAICDALFAVLFIAAYLALKRNAVTVSAGVS